MLGDVGDVGAGAVDLLQVALGVVLVGDGLVGGADVLPQAAEGVEGAAVGVVDGAATRASDRFMRAVAQGVQGVGEAVAVLVDDGRQSVGGVVFETDEAGVGAGEPGQLADGVVVERRGLAADAAGQEPAARAVAVGGDEAVGVGGLEDAAVGVVQIIGGDVAEGVGDALDLAAAAQGVAGAVLVGGVVVGGGEVGHINTGAVFDGLDEDAGDAGVVGVAGGPGVHLAAGGVLDAAAGDVAVAVVDGGGFAAGFGDFGRQAEAGVPFGEDLAFGAVGSRGVGGEVAGAGAGGEAFDAGGLQITREVVGVAGLVAVEVGVAGDVAVGVVGDGGGRGAAAGAAGLGDAGGLDDAEDGLEVVRTRCAERVGDGGAAVSVVSQDVEISAVGMAGGDGFAGGIVLIDGVAVAVLVGDACQSVRQIGIVGVGLLVVPIQPLGSIGVRDGCKIAL